MPSEAKRSALVLALVTVAGAGTMTVELSAVRLLAPWFGTSSGVWTNVIGVILLALALGYLLGARLSLGERPGRRLGLALTASGVATAFLPLFAAPVADAFLPRGLALDEVAGLLVWGSLAASLVLFLPAAFLLGCVGPLAVEVESRAGHAHAGDAGGRVLAASTLGSLAGTFATTHVFLPDLGLSRTFLGAALALGASGVVALFSLGGRPSRATTGVAAFLVCAVGAAIFTSRFRAPAPAAGLKLIAARESPYQSIRVVEAEDGTRFLQVNESLDSFQSVWRPESGLLGAGYYYDYFALPPAWARAGAGATPTDWRVCVVGLGAGTAVRVLEGVLGEAVLLESLGVEIDPVVVELGERYFDLARGPGRRVYSGLDGRSALELCDEKFDEIIVDAFANNMEVPAHLASIECFRACRADLRQGGWVVVNAAGFGLDDPVVEALAYTLAAAFEDRVLGVRVPFSRNCVLFARSGAPVPEPGGAGWNADGPAAALLPALELPGAWRVFGPDEGGLVLTDDRSPLDRLQLASVTAGRRRWVEGE